MLRVSFSCPVTTLLFLPFFFQCNSFFPFISTFSSPPSFFFFFDVNGGHITTWKGKRKKQNEMKSFYLDLHFVYFFFFFSIFTVILLRDCLSFFLCFFPTDVMVPVKNTSHRDVRCLYTRRVRHKMMKWISLGRNDRRQNKGREQFISLVSLEPRHASNASYAYEERSRNSLDFHCLMIL